MVIVYGVTIAVATIDAGCGRAYPSRLHHRSCPSRMRLGRSFFVSPQVFEVKARISHFVHRLASGSSWYVTSVVVFRCVSLAFEKNTISKNNLGVGHRKKGLLPHHHTRRFEVVDVSTGGM